MPYRFSALLAVLCATVAPPLVAMSLQDIPALPGTPPRDARPDSSALEQRRVRGAMERFFAAMRERDHEALAALLVDSGMLLFQRRNPDGSYTLRHRSNAQWLADYRGSTVLLEDVPGNSVVRVWGPIATISQPYILRRDGRLSHCGVNLFQMVKVGEDWRIANIVWTEERTGCGGGG